MSIRSVRNEIKKAMQTSHTFEEKSVTKKEAQKIVKEAEKGRVTAGELSEVVNLVKKGIDPSGVQTQAIPELRGDAFYLANDAKQVLESFIDRNSPTGGQVHTMAIHENPNDPTLI